jgi:hypothetical protein
MKEKDYIVQQTEKIYKKITTEKSGSSINPFTFTLRNVCQLKKINTELATLRPTNGILKFAAISLPKIPSNKLDFITNDEEYPKDLSVIHYGKETRKTLLKNYTECLSKAIDLKANIICINELGMPTNKSGLVNNNVIKFTKGIAQRNKCLIFSGTNHCTKSFLNKGYLFYPGNDKPTDPRDKEQPYRTFYKHVSAFRLKEPEKIYTPASRIIYNTQAFGIGISFLICLELSDFSFAAKIVNNHELINFLIVPTYVNDEFGSLVRCGENVSYAMGGAVALTNCHHEEGGRLNRVYINGKNISEIKPKTFKDYPIGDSLLTIYSIDVEKMKNDKISNSIKLEPSIQALYGIYDFKDR